MNTVHIKREPYSNNFKVWRDDRMAGPMRSRMNATPCNSKAEMLKEVARLFPEIDPEKLKEMEKKERELFPEKFKQKE